MSKRNNIINLIALIAIIVLINVIAQYYYTYFDFTDDKRFTLTEPTRKLLEEQKDVIFVKVMLGDELPAGFKRLKRSVFDILNQFKSINSNIKFIFQDPTVGTVKEVNKTKEELAKQGIIPVNLYIGEGSTRTQKSIYPYAIFQYGKRVYVVNLLEAQVRGVSQEVTLNNSVALLEYKFANAIQKLNMNRKANIAVVGDKGGIDDIHMSTLFRELDKYYNIRKFNIDSSYTIHPDIDLVIVPRPTKVFSKKNQFVLDQYLMKGGNIIWLMDKIEADLDSINVHKMYTPKLIDVGLDDLFFKYGIRINPNLVQDLQCTRIPQVIGMSGGEIQTERFPWYYDLLVNSVSEHPISNGIGDIYMPFVSTIDTIKTSDKTKKTILLTSSRTSRYQLYPMRLTFQILKYKPQIERFNKPYMPISVLVEGEFTSYFKNRLTQDAEKMLDKIGESFIGKSKEPGKMIFVADGEFVKNMVNTRTKEVTPIGFNKWEERKFQGNEDFILNAVEYMLDDGGIMSSRAKRIKLRLLDRGRLIKEKSMWRFVNIIMPLVLLAMFGVGFYYYRRKRYT